MAADRLEGADNCCKMFIYVAESLRQEIWKKSKKFFSLNGNWRQNVVRWAEGDFDFFLVSGKEFRKSVLQKRF